MGVKKGSRDSSEREKWDKIFKGLVKILRTKQDQLETLLKDRKILVDRINTQHDRWNSDVRLFEDHISMIKNEIETMDMMRVAEIAKSNLLVGLKDRDASLGKVKLDHAMDELDDFKAWFDFLTMNSKNETCSSQSAGDKSAETEIRKLRLEYGKLASDKNYEVSSLLRENLFAWNQFKRRETEFTDKLREKDDEIAQSNVKISSLVSHQEQLQLSNEEKDGIVSRLKAKVAAMEEEASEKDREISRLSKELELEKRSRTPKLTPVLTRCTIRKSSKTEEPSTVAAKKDLPGATGPASLNQSDQRSNRAKRKNQSNTLSSETPKLFTSTFKVPKLKAPSPQL
ncbi:PREDICTED: tropomyosin-like [Tarenaya hassleriana]|uniref:tropomyosin-like n=1 Tax=Tarenaya hassleriana TaxID=28532 RepID=UPI00053C6C95|nr:PREDICTED: tropomyosin-like [Tarenaya hassleriana]